MAAFQLIPVPDIGLGIGDLGPLRPQRIEVRAPLGIESALSDDRDAGAARAGEVTRQNGAPGLPARP